MGRPASRCMLNHATHGRQMPYWHPSVPFLWHTAALPPPALATGTGAFGAARKAAPLGQAAYPSCCGSLLWRPPTVVLQFTWAGIGSHICTGACGRRHKPHASTPKNRRVRGAQRTLCTQSSTRAGAVAGPGGAAWGSAGPDFDMSTLAHLSEGYASGTIDQARPACTCPYPEQ